MINQIELKDIVSFQANYLIEIESLLDEIDFSQVNQEKSYCKTGKSVISLSLLHKDDPDSIVTVILYRDLFKIRVSSFEYVSEESTELQLHEILKNALAGNYLLIDFMFENEVVAIKIEWDNQVIAEQILPIRYGWKKTRDIISSGRCKKIETKPKSFLNPN